MTVESAPVSSRASAPSRTSRWLPRLGWWLMMLLSLQTALISFRFLLAGPDVLYPDVPEGGPDVSGIAQHFTYLLEERWLRFAGHFVFGPIALAVGPFQFLAELRRKHPGLHRGLGWAYAVSVLVAGTAGLLLAVLSFGGLSTHIGFGMLAVLWLTTTPLAVWHARGRRFAEHRRFMVRSFALTFGAVTLRLYIPLFVALGVPFEEVYQTVAWLAWVPNLIVAEMFLARSYRGRTPAAVS